MVIYLARKLKLEFIFEENSEFFKLTMKMAPDKLLTHYGATLSREVKIPVEHILLQPSKKASPIGLLTELDYSIGKLVEDYGLSYSIKNLLTEPIELYFTTKTVARNRWNSVTQHEDRNKLFRDILPELAEWAGYPVSDIIFVTFVDEDPQKIPPEDYNLTIAQLVDKYGSDFEIQSLSGVGW